MNEKLKIMDVAKKEEKLSIFTKALTATGLEGKLREQGPFTILAPTNTAFSEFPGVEDLLSSKKKDQLKDLLASQIIKGK